MKNCEIEIRILELAEKWMNGSISPEEEVEFDLWYNGELDAKQLDNQVNYKKENFIHNSFYSSALTKIFY